MQNEKGPSGGVIPPAVLLGWKHHWTIFETLAEWKFQSSTCAAPDFIRGKGCAAHFIAFLLIITIIRKIHTFCAFFLHSMCILTGQSPIFTHLFVRVCAFFVHFLHFAQFAQLPCCNLFLHFVFKLHITVDFSYCIFRLICALFCTCTFILLLFCNSFAHKEGYHRH